ncbi:lysozyme inhibitor LprI family protein [Mesorhizobium sp. CA5]|uniref:lysozyme inhibitor LprI family protein n=1 Tax=Mesorhizobium sp. CA5 TaxID=2876638 RepID=UPI001CD0895E|nr:lysozyme inhibitor LprI family protein [Mesorhizobium sp. CA5]MBZ9846258.1 lysozyme inhibitor LprI family protein [Mesorhizobium sp. CA5]
MRRLLLPACLALLATAPAAFAEDCDRNDDSQSMLNICADADYQAADAKLNAAYKNIVGSNDQASNKLLQRAWIAFRDAECAYATAESEGGSIHPMEVSECLTTLTNDRIKQLTSDASCKLSDPSCAGSDAGDDQDMQ